MLPSSTVPVQTPPRESASGPHSTDDPAGNISPGSPLPDSGSATDGSADPAPATDSGRAGSRWLTGGTLLVLLQLLALLAVGAAGLPGSPIVAPDALALVVPPVLLGTTLALVSLARRAGDTAAGDTAAGALWLMAAGYAASTVALTVPVLPGVGLYRPVSLLATAARVAQMIGVVLLLWRHADRNRRAGLDLTVLVTGASAIGALAVELVLTGPARATGPAPILPPFVWLTLMADVVIFVLVVTAVTMTGRGLHQHAFWPATGLVVVVVSDLISLRVNGSPALIAGLARWPVPHACCGLSALLGHAMVGWGVVPAGHRARIGTALRTLIHRPHRDRPAASGQDRPATFLLVGCSLLVAACLLVPDMPRVGAVIGLACLVAELFRTRGVLRADRARRTTAGVGGPTGSGMPETDALTGLASRGALAAALAARRDLDAGPEPDDRGRTGLLLVDLDNFRDVNEALGHTTGDRLLTAVGARLRAVLQPDQMLARLGSDEYAVLLPGAGAQEAQESAGRLRAALREPFDVDGARLHVAASIGIATASATTTDSEAGDLLRRADVALHQAQRDRAGQVLYDPRDDDGSERLRRTGELRQAVARGDIEVYLQPQVDLRTGRIVGAEALARWRHPHDGVLLPAAFLPLAEHTGLARPMAALVLDRALAACASWWIAGHRIPVSINLGADDLRDTALPGRVTAALERCCLPPSALRVEITEQTLLTDPEAAAELFGRWRADGISVSIDDFGTGYSSLAYLSRLPVDELKLDRAFVADLARPTTETIVRHTIAMAHGLGARVVAEGIEDAGTAHRLAMLDCDVGQGLVHGAAVTLPEFLDRLGQPPDRTEYQVRGLRPGTGLR